MSTPAPCCKQALADATVTWPKRNRESDGIMGDSAHKARKSDHNDGNAFDLGHDPKNGVDCNILAKQVISDARVSYVIWNREIYGRERAREGWRKYGGTNGHTHHMHVSIRPESRDDLSPWPWTSTPDLNERYSFSDVRYLISRAHGALISRDHESKDKGSIKTVGRRVSYDAGVTFVEYPKKVLLPVDTTLVRLDPPLLLGAGIFSKVWWMGIEESHRFSARANETSENLRVLWQQQQALPKLSKGVRIQVYEIRLIKPVWAWVGKTAPLFKKMGGAEQIYLPNLAEATGSYRSDHAMLSRTYCLPDR